MVAQTSISWSSWPLPCPPNSRGTTEKFLLKAMRNPSGMVLCIALFGSFFQVAEEDVGAKEASACNILWPLAFMHASGGEPNGVN